MELHFIYNPNRWLANAKAGSAEVRVHRAGCRDIAKEKRGSTSDYVSAFDSQVDAAEEWWADFIAEESMTAEDAMNYTDFMPCTAGLPVRLAAVQRGSGTHAVDCGLQGSGLDKSCTCGIDKPAVSLPNPTADKLAAAHNRTAYRIAELQVKLEWLQKKERSQYAAAMAALHDGQHMRHDKEPEYGANAISVVY